MICYSTHPVTQMRETLWRKNLCPAPGIARHSKEMEIELDANRQIPDTTSKNGPACTERANSTAGSSCLNQLEHNKIQFIQVELVSMCYKGERQRASEPLLYNAVEIPVDSLAR
ncbi:hypothetical protein [Mycobacterium sp. 4858]|uniref:hypothetical protein n=1 Tax=Mycobacterium sp. 4858 TaxID=2057185 RepID=UPI00115A0B9E|nr:hypothetical protein [Mycobacterium sp. 4858]